MGWSICDLKLLVRHSGNPQGRPRDGTSQWIRIQTVLPWSGILNCRYVFQHALSFQCYQGRGTERLPNIRMLPHQSQPLRSVPCPTTGTEVNGVTSRLCTGEHTRVPSPSILFLDCQDGESPRLQMSELVSARAVEQDSLVCTSRSPPSLHQSHKESKNKL